MSKSDQIALGRNQGLAFALKITAEAQQAGKDPVEALRVEMRARRLMGLQILATQKELDKASETIKATTAKNDAECLHGGLVGTVRFRQGQTHKAHGAFHDLCHGTQ